MKTKPKKIEVRQPSSFDFHERFPDEKSARDYMVSARWPAGIRCIHCGHDQIYTIREGNIYTCKSCRKQFTVRTGTVMEDSHISIVKWLYAMYLVSVSRKGISSIQLAKEIGITQKSAWYLLGRIRESCQLDGKISGIVEADETFIGGKEKNKHNSKKLNQGRGTVGKAIVFGVRSRDGQIRAEVISNTDRETMKDTVARNVMKGSTLYTDEHSGYDSVQGYDHERVCHSGKEYVRGNIHTNSIEGVWALIKRGHYGVYHQWSKKHLHRYLHEFIFRLSTLDLPAFGKKDTTCGINIVRVLAAGMEGKRLTYKALIG
jgi:transposase-like protein